MKTYRSFSSAETKLFGENLAKKLAKRQAPSAKRKNAIVFALTGELGSGKTTFIQGFLRGFGVKRGGSSPTFVLIKRYALRNLSFASIFHVDAYRIKKPNEFLKLGFKEILADPKSIVIIEWADNIKKILPRNTFWLRFSHEKKENERKILVR